MILSFHPIVEADQNILCAGRQPGASDLAAITAAAAVILPQGCPEALYRMARAGCRHVFPNLDAKFDYPGKKGQARLFSEIGVAHPPTTWYDSVAAFRQASTNWAFPLVVKWDWGGQGETVFKAEGPANLARVLDRAASCEETGQGGFLVQRFIPCRQRALRVVRIGTRMVSYWRIQPMSGAFGTSVAGGSRIDPLAEPPLQAAARAATEAFCLRTGLQLAGFDFIFDERRLAEGRLEPLLLEINYFFGRTGLGGSTGYYALLVQAIDTWLAGLGMDLKQRGDALAFSV